MQRFVSSGSVSLSQNRLNVVPARCTDGAVEHPTRQKTGAGQLHEADGGDLEFKVARRAPPDDDVAHFGADERAGQG